MSWTPQVTADAFRHNDNAPESIERTQRAEMARKQQEQIQEQLEEQKRDAVARQQVAKRLQRAEQKTSSSLGHYWNPAHGGKKLKYRRRKTKKMGNRKHKKTMRRKGKRRNRRTKKR